MISTRSLSSSLKTSAYATGVGPGVAGLFRRAGAASALVPANPPISRLRRSCPISPRPQSVRDLGPSLDVAFHGIWVERCDRNRLTSTRRGSGEELSPAAAEHAQTRHLRCPVQRSRFFTSSFAQEALDDGRLGVDLGFVPARDAALLLAEYLPRAKDRRCDRNDSAVENGQDAKRDRSPPHRLGD